MVAPKIRGKKTEISSEELKTLLIKTARRHFAQHGYQGASLKEIAKDAGVAGSLLNYHFGDKGGLFKACIESFARDRMVAIVRILSHPKSKDEMRVRLELFVDEMLSSIIADPHGFDIMEREMRSNNTAVLKIFQETLLQAFHAVVDFFKQAQAEGLLRADADPMLSAVFLFTTSCDAARKDHLGKKFFNLSFSNPEWRRNFVRQIVELFTSGVMK